MRFTVAVILFAILITFMSVGQDQPDGPSDEKAKKTYQGALDYLKKHETGPALDAFRKADKQDGGHCVACQKRMIRYGAELHDWKTAELGAEEMVTEAHTDKEQAFAHYEYGLVLMAEGNDKHKDELYTRAHEEFGKALSAYASFPDALLADGKALACLKQDEAAKAQFQKYLAMAPANTPDRERAARYLAQPELARARLAPAFSITTLDGKQVSLDSLAGRVVLLDFWATWCGPCRAALPHMRSLAARFQGQPLVILSISVDDDEQKWKQFVASNGMTWPQYYDGGFSGPVAKLFGITAIPQTFTIDSEGVLQDQHIGDAEIEGKLKKLVDRAHQAQLASSAH